MATTRDVEHAGDRGGAHRQEVRRLHGRRRRLLLVDEGEIFGLLGPNGAGKSTLIRMMTTLIPITSGNAFIAGLRRETRADDVRR